MSTDVKCSCLLDKFLPSELEVMKCERISQVMVAQAEKHFIVIGGAGSKFRDHTYGKHSMQIIPIYGYPKFS